MDLGSGLRGLFARSGSNWVEGGAEVWGVLAAWTWDG